MSEHIHTSELEKIDKWLRARMRSIKRKRQGRKGQGRKTERQRWPNRYFTALGLFILKDAKEAEIAGLPLGANH